MANAQSKCELRGRSSIWPFLVSASAVLVFAWFYFLRYPLPFFGYFSDPEVAYIFSAVQLSELGYVQMTDHPGTFLQCVGVGIARLLGLDFTDLFVIGAYDEFRFYWLVLSVLGIVTSLYLLWRQLWNRPLVYLCAVLILIHDFHTLMYLGRFSPEGGFIGLYLLVLVCACRKLSRQTPLSIHAAVAWGILLGAVTTIKITLWPVTAFILGAFLCLSPMPFKQSRLWLWGGMLLSALSAYFVLGSIFAEDVRQQMSWFLRLLSESGRYGNPGQVDGSFLPLSDILRFTFNGYSLQSYTTLFPVCVLSLIALWDCLRSPSMAQRLLAAGFLFCLLLSFVIYAKHPYQIKYLLPQTYLMLGYWVLRFGAPFSQEMNKKYLGIFACGLALVCLNAWVNFNIIHRYNYVRYAEIEAKIDRIIASVPHASEHFSIEVPYPSMVYGFGVREIPDARPYFEAHRPNVSVFRERNQDYSIASSQPLPIEKIDSGALIFTKRSFQDQRVRPVLADPDLQLYVYWATE